MKINKNLSIILFLIFSNLVCSNPVDSTLAKEVGIKYFSFLNPSRSELEIKNTIVKYYNGYPSYYIVNFNEGGYMAVSANDATIPILMYSYGGEYIENGFHNPAYLDWMENYSKEIDSVRANNVSNDSAIIEWHDILNENFDMYKGTKSVQPLISTEWGQTFTNDSHCPGFNSLCSSDNNNCNCNHCAAGCVAIAMAQVMKYWMHPVHYTYQDYDWCNMPDKLLYNSGNNQDFDIQQNAIAELVHDCGVNANMNYCMFGDCESFAWPNNAKNALTYDFGYSDNADLDRRQYYTKKKWIKKLKNDLDNESPVIYFSLSGLFGGGHAFIFDGYNSDDKFHINWGWYGNHQGNYLDGYEYYEIGELTPGSHNYNLKQRAIFNLHPAWYVDCNNTHHVYQFLEDWLPTWYYEPVAGNIIAGGGSTQSQLTIQSDQTVHYKAYRKIDLLDGFTAEHGSNFTAEIIQCPAECPVDSKSLIAQSNNYNEEIELDYDTICKNNTNLAKNEIVELKFQVFPNPFDNFTNIIFGLQQPSKVNIYITNSYGQKIHQVYNKFAKAGKYKIKLDGADLQPGLYFCIMETNKSREVIKIVKM